MIATDKTGNPEMDAGTSSGKLQKSRTGLKIAVGIVGLLIVIGLAGWFTLTLDPALPPMQGALYPFTSTYDLLVPDGEKLMIGNTGFIVLTVGDEAFLKLGETREKLSVGDEITIAEKRAVVKTLGMTILDTNYRIDTTYRGMVNGKADFYLTVKTSSQIPQFLIDRMLPAGMQARPI